MQHAFTVDVEDWYQGIPLALDGTAATRRLERGLDSLLELLDRHDCRATFFVLGPVAREYPKAVRRIADAGHEVGSHGWSHDLIYSMSRDRFREETQRASAVIEDLCGRAVRAYRAAYFSITRESYWALTILSELGFLYDSSIFPVRNWRYGIPDFDPRPQRIRTEAGDIAEFPISVRHIFGRNVPVTGGAYFRIYPYRLTHANLMASERDNRSSVFYIHPWELDPDHPRVAFYWKARLTHYANLRSVHQRLERLLADFRFTTLGAVLDESLARYRS